MRHTTKVNDVHPPVEHITAKKSFHHEVGLITPAHRATTTWPARHAHGVFAHIFVSETCNAQLPLIEDGP